jgi:Uma2 family endonuclease
VDLGPEQLHRLSLDEYHRLVESGAIDEDARVELIDGLLATMGAKTRAHENAIAWLARWLMLAVGLDRYEVRIASPLTLATSEPEPDLAVIPHDAPRLNHPATAALVIEVAVSSQQRDLDVKPLLYAQAGIAEYWVLDLDVRRLIAHRHPSSRGYAERVDIDANAVLLAQAVRLPALALADVLAAVDA